HLPRLPHCIHASTLPTPTSTLFPYTTLFRSPSTTSTSTRTITPPACLRRAIMHRLRGLATYRGPALPAAAPAPRSASVDHPVARSEEHTSELQSRENLVCRLLLEKKKELITH